METTAAATLQKKKINRGKLKKTIKNVLCRPDPVYWPNVTDEQKQKVEAALSKYKVQIPEFQKLLWKDLKSIPKEQRPKPPKPEKIKGLLFGISECSNAIKSGQCAGVIVEALVNPRTIVQPLLASCAEGRIPVICIEGLRKATKIFFGIPTSCLGVQKEFLTEISTIISELGSNKLSQKKTVACNIEDIEMTIDKKNLTPMDTQESFEFDYLYRVKKSRVFIPPSGETRNKQDKKFKGQDFIEFSNKSEPNKEPFKKMMVKRISNNPNRVKVKRIKNNIF